jgi:hypothetical protein
MSLGIKLNQLSQEVLDGLSDGSTLTTPDVSVGDSLLINIQTGHAFTGTAESSGLITMTTGGSKLDSGTLNIETGTSLESGSGNLTISTGQIGGTSLGKTGHLYLKSGSSAGTGGSGDVIIQIGDTFGPNPGNIRLDDGTAQLGYVFTSLGTDGKGTWQELIVPSAGADTDLGNIVDITSSIIPTSTAITLGSPGKPFGVSYFTDISIMNGGSQYGLLNVTSGKAQLSDANGIGLAVVTVDRASPGQNSGDINIITGTPGAGGARGIITLDSSVNDSRLAVEPTHTAGVPTEDRAIATMGAVESMIAEIPATIVYADQVLSNLTGPTSIPDGAHLIPLTNGGIDIGSGFLQRIGVVYSEKLDVADSGGSSRIIIDPANNKIQYGSGFGNDFLIENTSNTSNTSITTNTSINSAGSGAILLTSGDAISGVSGDSGAIILKTGTSTSGTRGDIALDASTINIINNKMKIKDLGIEGNSGSTTITDGATAQALITRTVSSHKFMVIEYSIERLSEVRIGRLLVTANGGVAFHSHDYTDSADVNIEFTSTLTGGSGGSIILSATDTIGGSTSTFKYSIRHWS